MKKAIVIIIAVLLNPTVSLPWADIGVGYFAPAEDKTGNGYSFVVAARIARGVNILPGVGFGVTVFRLETASDSSDIIMPFYIEPRLYIPVDDKGKLFFHGGTALGYNVLGGYDDTCSFYAAPGLGMDYWISKTPDTPFGISVQAKYANYRAGEDWWRFYGFEVGILAVGGCNR